MINDSLLSTFYKFHDHKQKIVKAFKKFLFPLKFKIFEIRGFDSTATLYCGKWRKISKSRCDLDLGPAMPKQYRACPRYFYDAKYSWKCMILTGI